jgi:lysozyme
MNINQAGIDLLKRFEGLRLEAYQDLTGKWSIGYGHTDGVYKGMIIKPADAESFLKRDLESFESVVRSRVSLDLNANQFSALVCFAYNIGAYAFKTSVMLALLNDNKTEEAMDDLLNWCHHDGKIIQGLFRRRLAEKNLFFKS